jgi:hypothetical protein
MFKEFRIIFSHMLSQIILDQNNLPLHKIKEMYRVILIGKKNESVVSWSLFYAETSLERERIWS